MALPKSRLLACGMTSAEFTVLDNQFQAVTVGVQAPTGYPSVEPALMENFFHVRAKVDIEEWLAQQRVVYGGEFFATEPAQVAADAALAKKLVPEKVTPPVIEG